MLDRDHKWNVTAKPLIIGVVLSAILTGVMYGITEAEVLKGWGFALTIFALACIQALIQFVFFLHLGLEAKPHWNLITFLFLVVIIIVVIGGSLWIMNNLGYHMEGKHY